ncbi:MAG: hypothetical protein WCA16_03985, partial [Candidatus Sulfotelmatobacter sp.]
MLMRLIILGLSFVLAGALFAQVSLAAPARDVEQTKVAPPDSPDWTEPFPAHRMIGNIYYVGSRGLASYLITT